MSCGKLSSNQLDKLNRLDKWLKANPNSAIADFSQEPEVMSPDLSVISHQPLADNLSTASLDKLSFIRSRSLMPANNCRADFQQSVSGVKGDRVNRLNPRTAPE